MEGYPIVLGNYEFIAPIAEGGFGQVYLARMGGAAGFSRTVAVKRIRPEYTSAASFVSDFIKEARIGGMLTHHNVVQVLGFEEIQGQYFLIMEYVDGVGLDYVIRFTRKRGETLPLSIVAEIVAQAAEGLHYVHSLKNEDGSSLRLVHRDLKPSNIMISRLGVVKITDFGVARSAIEVGMKTQAGLIKGTLAYLSPEQARDEELDNRSDLYALGAILYELLTLRRLFPNESVFTTLEALGHNEVEEPLKGIPPDAEIFLPLLRGLLTERAEDRIAAGGEVARQAREIQLKLTTATVSLAPFAERWIEARQAELTLRRLGKAGPPKPGQGTGASAENREKPSDQPLTPAQEGPVPRTEVQTGPDKPVRGAPTEILQQDTLSPDLSSELIPCDTEEGAGKGAEHDETPSAERSQQGSRRRLVAVVAAACGFLAALVVWFLVVSPGGQEPRRTASLEVEPPASLRPEKAVPASPAPSPATQPAGDTQEDHTVSVPPVEASHVEKSSAAQTGKTVKKKHKRVRPKAASAPPQSIERSTPPRVKTEPAGSTEPTEAASKPDQKDETRPSSGQVKTAPATTTSDIGEATHTGKPAEAPAKASTPRPPKAVAALPPGRLTVTSRPSALIYLDGKSIGESPMKARAIPPGTYSIRLSRPDLGFHQEATVTIEAGKDVRVMCTSSGCDVVGP